MQNCSTSALYLVSSLYWSTGLIQPASAHSGSQLSETHSVSIGALPTNLVTSVSRYCAHGVFEYMTLSPVLASKAATWLLTVSTAADQVSK